MADQVKKTTYFSRYGEKARSVLEAILDKYADEGLSDVENLEVLRVDPISQIGTPIEIINEIFQGKDNYLAAIHRLETCLYTAEC